MWHCRPPSRVSVETHADLDRSCCAGPEGVLSGGQGERFAAIPDSIKDVAENVKDGIDTASPGVVSTLHHKQGTFEQVAYSRTGSLMSRHG